MSEGLERVINVKEYVEDRALQVAQLLQMVDNTKLVNREVTKGPRTAAQRLPRHMRRRAMAYEIRRFPKGLRAFAAPHVKLTKHRKKPPSRFWRRRPSNLLLNYIRRNRRATWLESHIWHAKRFHMIHRWGYRLPDRSFQRNFRPCYRDSVHHCSIRDKSYLTCFVLSCESQENLTNLLKPIFENLTSPTPAFKSSLSGRFEVSTNIYEPGQYPSGFICPARFQWCISKDEAKLILWLHPTSKDQVLKLLLDILKLTKYESNSDVDLDKAESKEEWRLKAMKFNTETYKNEESGIQLQDLRDQMVRLRLYGPRALPIVSSMLKLSNSKEYINNHDEWKNTFSLLQAGTITDGAVFSLLVEDPRISRPQKKRVPLDKDTSEIHFNPSHCEPQTDLWSLPCRIDALEKRLCDSALKTLNSKTVGEIAETPAKIPVQVIIRNMGTGKANTLTGCELIAPSGFGLDFWISAQLYTAHASGLRDDYAAHLEARRFVYPTDSVDCHAGFEEEKRVCLEHETKYKKRPHNRRVLYWDKLSVKHPFSFEFEELVKDWLPDNSETAEKPVFVLRNRRVLRFLESVLANKSPLSEELMEEYKHSLVPVQLDCLARGRPRKFALICLPTREDLKKIKWRHHDGPVIVVQPPRHTSDCDEKQKGVTSEEPMDCEETGSTSKSEQKKKWQDSMWKDVVNVDPSTREKAIPLKPLFPDNIIVDRKSKRKLLNQKKKVNAKKRKTEHLDRLARIEAERLDKLNITYKDAANRVTIGRVVRGDFAFSESKGSALGYIPFKTLLKVKELGGTVLVRNSTSKYYHPATLTVSTAMCEI